jgi:predicted nucleic acid-binding protein
MIEKDRNATYFRSNNPTIADTSVLVAFSAVHEMKLLEKITGRLIVPGSVFRELVTDGVGWDEAKDAQKEVLKRTWVDIVDLESEGVALLPCSGINAGEAEVIALAKAWDRIPLIDEPRGRREAKRHGLMAIGSLGILGAAVQLGFLSRAGPVIWAMKQKGLRFGDELVANFVRKLGESWSP